jgi:hypothetical protein
VLPLHPVRPELGEAQPPRARSLSRLSARFICFYLLSWVVRACTEREGHEQQLPHLVLRLLPDHFVCRHLVLLPLLGTGPLSPFSFSVVYLFVFTFALLINYFG